MKKSKIIACASFAVLTSIMLTGCGEKTIDLTKYVDVEFSGVNGKGTATVNVDYGELEDDIETSAKTDGLTIIGLANLEDSVKFKLDKDENLKNGDTVKVNISYNNDKAKKYGIKFKCKTTTVKVSDLKKKKEIDAFAKNIFDVEKNGVVISYTGISPTLQASIENNIPSDNPLSKVVYTFEKDSGWGSVSTKKGEKLKITATLPDELANKGYVLKKETTTITVKDVPEYISDVKEIDADTMQQIKLQCNDIFNAKIRAKSVNAYITVSDDEYLVTNDEAEVSDVSYDKFYLISPKTDKEGNTLYITGMFNVNNSKKRYSSNEFTSLQNVLVSFEIDNLYVDKNGKYNFSVEDVSIKDVNADVNAFKNRYINKYLDNNTVSETQINW